jgi:hypothetical protein
MAAATHALLEWEMNLPSLKFCHHGLMAGKTELLLWLGENILIGTGMWIVALDTLASFYGSMDVGLIKLALFLLVALVTEITTNLGEQLAHIAGMGCMATVTITLIERGMNHFFL